MQRYEFSDIYLLEMFVVREVQTVITATGQFLIGVISPITFTSQINFTNSLMEIIAIEEQAFEVMTAKFKNMVERVHKLCSSKNELNKDWLDNQEVCQLLSISKRTLQYYRNSGKISYTQIGYKNFYKVSDIEIMLKELEQKPLIS